MPAVSSPRGMRFFGLGPFWLCSRVLTWFVFFSGCFVGNELQEIVNLWISWLPIEFDELEAKAVHGHFCNLIARYRHPPSTTPPLVPPSVVGDFCAVLPVEIT